MEQDEGIDTGKHDGKERKRFFDRYGPPIVLAGIVIYLALLITGVIAEIFKIQSILDWWIWRPPGK
ncbi:MAG TPA: hypothetical protein VFG09_05105 [Thermodesulfovibrionales bacterium]|nr:hypothetical protein [Thermodesulfovibrionales bacterium]